MVFNPSPKRIARMCKKFRDNWSEEDELRRRVCSGVVPARTQVIPVKDVGCDDISQVLEDENRPPPMQWN